MKNLSLLALFFAVFSRFSMAQDYPKNDFLPPLEPPIIITGTFGEIRDGHFHSGIDLSTNEEEGVPVMAAADGYVSRIKIAADGYGKALYITHRNGFVTVYGHLEKFTAALNAYVRNIQYEKQIFELDVKPEPNEFPVRQRDVIAYSGATGGAMDPHLHFEIRDETTEEPINPQLFGITCVDSMKPEIKYISIIPIREGGIVNFTDSAYLYDLRYDSTLKKTFLNSYDNPEAYGNIGFGFSATDRRDSSENVLGIYSAELYVDDKLTFTIKYDRFNFDNTRDVNAHIDYLAYKRDNTLIERCHRLPGDQLKFYNEEYGSGYVNFEENQAHEIRIVVRDFNWNTAEVTFPVNAVLTLSANQYMPRPKKPMLLSNIKGTGVHKPKLEVTIPDDALYENFLYNDDEQPGYGYVSNVYRVGDEFEPLKTPITVGVAPENPIEERLKSKAVLVRINGSEQYAVTTALGGEWKNNFLTAKSGSFGSFAIAIDTMPPRVEKYYVPADMNTMFGGVVKLIIRDGLSGIKSYSGKIDGEWILFEYDKKSDMVTANVSSKDVNLEHPIEITVIDKCGNSKTWKSTFYF